MVRVRLVERVASSWRAMPEASSPEDSQFPQNDLSTGLRIMK
jgi:hypothetical protein